MNADFFIFRTIDGAILRKLNCPNDPIMIAVNLNIGEDYIAAPADATVTDATHCVDPQTLTFIARDA